MDLNEIISVVRELPAVDKLKLIQLLAEELDSNEDISPFEQHKVYYLPTPYNSFGVAEMLAKAIATDNLTLL